MKFDLFFLSFLYKGTSGATYGLPAVASLRRKTTPLSFNHYSLRLKTLICSVLKLPMLTLVVALRAIFVLFWRIK
jgi:hypothetical protein|nr:MAG TPA: hypothetical protein [Caudoviricetes sp.]DAY39549.1 MAG TPA: hypothetical protein [Caudoviricetes sp.]